MVPVRGNLIKFYPYREKALLDYLDKSPVHLNNREELERMLDFLTAKQ
jgi:hypothetical protein